MSEHSTNTPEHRHEDASIGELLRVTREKASYSIGYVSAHTHLTEQIIIALENDEHEMIASPVYVKGYIRSYAKLLELDIEPLLGQQQSASCIECVTPQVKKPKKVRSSGADPVVIWSSVTVVALLAGLLLTWWFHHDDSDPVELAAVVDQFDNAASHGEREGKAQASIAPNSEQNQPHTVGLGSVDPKHISDKPNATFQPDDALPIPEVTQDSSTTTNESQSHSESPVSSDDTEKVRITVRYNEESWTEIFDARKRRLLHGLIQPGATRVISGQAPFNVFLGNSPGVELEINGKPFDHSAYVRGNNTARFLIEDNNS